MWGVDDEIRADIKEINNKLSANAQNQNIPLEKAEEAVNRVIEMILKKKIFFSQWLWRL